MAIQLNCLSTTSFVYKRHIIPCKCDRRLILFKRFLREIVKYSIHRTLGRNALPRAPWIIRTKVRISPRVDLGRYTRSLLPEHLVSWVTLGRRINGNTRQRVACVPGSCWIYRDEMFPTGMVATTVAERSGRNPRGPSERTGGKLSTGGTRTGSEAGCGGRAGEHRRSPTVINTALCRACRRERKEPAMTQGDLGGESLREVSRGHSNEDVR
jgi:hypothetical protein